MAKLFVIVMVLAVMCYAEADEAAPRLPSLGFLNPSDIMTGIQRQMNQMMSGDYLKNQQGNGQSVSLISRAPANGEPSYEAVVRNMKDGQITEKRMTN